MMLLVTSLLALAYGQSPRSSRQVGNDTLFSKLSSCHLSDCLSGFPIAEGEKALARFRLRINNQTHLMLITNYAIRFVNPATQFAMPVTAVSIIEQLNSHQLNFTSSVKKWMILEFDRPITRDKLIASINRAQKQLLRLHNSGQHHLTSEPDYLLTDYCSNGPCQLFHNYHKKHSRVDGKAGFGWYCRTYSPRDFVPGLRETIHKFPKIVEARGRNRFLLISYVDKSGGVLLRCSQPNTMYDVSQMAIEREARYLRDVFPGRKFSVFDLRPRSSAYANLKQGGGYEDVSLFGPGAEITFCGIENILVVSKSFESNPTAWRDQLFVIFENLNKVVECLESGRVVITHCTDGWDRTPQMASLPQIVLEPRARTIRGFLTILVREFSRRGHNMGLRNNLFKQILPKWDNNLMFEKSPILLQFFDLVFQLHHANPTAFEFSPRLLEFLAWHVYSCQFSEFLGDDAMIRLKSYNREYAKLIDYVVQNKSLYASFVNSNYNANSRAKLRIPTVDDYVKFDALHSCFFPGGC